MRIAFLVGRFPVLSETFVLNQVTGLIERGHEVDIYALDGPVEDINNFKVHPDVEKYQLLQRTYCAPIATEPGDRFRRALDILGLLLAKYFKHPSTIGRSLNIYLHGKQELPRKQILVLAIPFLDKKPYDIIHCQFGVFALKGMLLRHLGIVQGKLITTFRGFDISLFVQQCGEHVYDQLFATGDFFLSNCEFFRHRAIILGCDEKKIIVHGSGIDCSRFCFTPRVPAADGKVRIATTGRLVEKKGIEYSIRAVAQLATDHPNIEYKIIGDGPLKEQLQQLIQELNVGHIIQLLGWKHQQELVEILNDAHIFVATSVTAKSGNQDAPVNTLKEAMAMGMPVIGTLHGGIPELVEDGVSGFLVPERDVDALAEKLGYLIQHPEVWQRMGQAGRAYVEQHYDKNKLNDELVRIYEQLLVDQYTSKPATATLETI